MAQPTLRMAVAGGSALERVPRAEGAQGESRTKRIHPGEYYVTAADESITTVLGSCISACIRDPTAGVGGMNHFMLPELGGGADCWLDPSAGLATRYGSYAMESLMNDLMKRGARREQLEIKLFGGAQILASSRHIGRRNIEFIRKFLRIEGLRAVAEDLGNIHPRTIAYSPRTGKAHVQRLRPLDATAIAAREKNYMAEIAGRSQAGDVEIF
jgi:chemotaxis protein CheD